MIPCKIDMFVSFIYNTYIQTVATHSILATKKHPTYKLFRPNFFAWPRGKHPCTQKTFNKQDMGLCTNCPKTNPTSHLSALGLLPIFLLLLLGRRPSLTPHKLG
jgi:hypothetical protein